MTNSEWRELVSSSRADAFVRVQTSIQAGDLADAMDGLACLVEAMANSDVNAIKSKMLQICAHVYKIMIDPGNRAYHHWAGEIETWRDQIEGDVTSTPSYWNLLEKLLPLIPQAKQVKMAYRGLDQMVPYGHALPTLTLHDVMTRDLDDIQRTYKELRNEHE